MKLEEARKNKGLTQEQVTKKVDVTLRHYVNIEKGVSIPAVDVALQICKLFEIDPYEVDEWKKSQGQ